MFIPSLTCFRVNTGLIHHWSYSGLNQNIVHVQFTLPLFIFKNYTAKKHTGCRSVCLLSFFGPSQQLLSPQENTLGQYPLHGLRAPKSVFMRLSQLSKTSPWSWDSADK